MTKYTVGMLIKELEKLPKDKIIALVVNYEGDNYVDNLFKVVNLFDEVFLFGDKFYD